MHRVSYVLPEGFQVMALATQAVFEFANVVAGEPFYEVTCHSMPGGSVKASLGTALQTRPFTARSTADTWMVVGVIDPLGATPSPPQLLQALRKCSARARRTVGLCTGAFVLAEAGLLAGRRATTHWAYADALQRRHPDVQVEQDRIFIADDPIWTSAGMTAELDLALGLVGKDLGDDVARSVAHRLVMHQRRSGGQSQHSEILNLTPRSDRIARALEHARRHLAQPLGVEELAAAANLSPRQFSRVFTAETGQSPAKAVERLRVEAARLMIERSRHPLEVIARETGFRDRRHLREAFMRGFGKPPQSLRRDARLGS
ncbi:MAG TPA: GlxA family transcriptional regulator [Ideonella sp.]|uniref:GlxA family transcriptional regulator n=1 Tax=Ideonella sp. TaxID=1929293 RepID=UPI002E34B401|nr:GlxA family transcriptional regulator [Ideonella sp.]HEX5684895.1 GlxA family transcriptional regulator [Ideonella sp.]